MKKIFLLSLFCLIFLNKIYSQTQMIYTNRDVENRYILNHSLIKSNTFYFYVDGKNFLGFQINNDSLHITYNTQKIDTTSKLFLEYLERAFNADKKVNTSNDNYFYKKIDLLLDEVKKIKMNRKRKNKILKIIK